MGEQVGLSAPSVVERIKKLENENSRHNNQLKQTQASHSEVSTLLDEQRVAASAAAGGWPRSPAPTPARSGWGWSTRTRPARSSA